MSVAGQYSVIAMGIVMLPALIGAAYAMLKSVHAKPLGLACAIMSVVMSGVVAWHVANLAGM